MKSRTNEEIKIYYRQLLKQDLLRLTHIDVLIHMPFDDAKEFLHFGIKKNHWNKEAYIKPNAKNIKAKLIDYIPFAWQKANNCRGISAYRSLLRFQNWFWLLGEDEMYELCRGDYEHYGKEKLIEITKWAGLNPDDFDNGIRVNSDDE